MTLLPIIAPKINVHPGTLEEANAAGYIMERSTPFEIHGFLLKEEFVGDMAQEWWEAAWQQRRIVIGTPAVVVAGLILAFTVNLFLGLALAGVGGFAAFKLLGNQTAASEEFSHAISVQASLFYDGLTMKRAEECFIGNLGGYTYGRPLSASNVRNNYPAAKEWVDANKPLMERFKAMKEAL